MKYYVDVTLLPNAEIPLYFLWEKVYQQLHLALVEIKNKDEKSPVGVSFPSYDKGTFSLGCKLRLFASTSSELESLDINRWLSRLSDYVHITSIQNVPDGVDTYACFKRLQLKNNNERLARRRAKRQNIGIEEARTYFNGRKEKSSRAPFIRIKSSHSNNQYHLMIFKEKAETLNTDECFSTYGLSASSSVPIF